MGQNEHLGNSLKHRQKFIVMVITSVMQLSKSFVRDNSLTDKPSFLLSRKSTICSPVPQFHEDYSFINKNLISIYI